MSPLAALVIQRARRLIEGGSLDEAYELLQNIREADKTDHTICLQARREIETRLLIRMRELFADRRVCPRQTGTSTQLRAHKLTSFEAYVWGLFDGGTSLEDALALTNVPELDTLRAIAKLLDKGLLACPTPNRLTA